MRRNASKNSSRRARLSRPARNNTLSPYDLIQIRRPKVEVKLFPIGALSQSYFNAAAGQYLIDLTTVTQGVSGAQRVGDHLHATRLHLRGVINNGVGTTANSRNVTRIIIFQYFGDGSVANKPIISDFLQTSAANVGTTYGSFSTFDIDYARQHRVLWDSGLILTFGTAQIAVTGVPQIGVFHTIDKEIPLDQAERDIHYYNGATSGDNHIYMLVTADQVTQTTNPTWTYSSEFRFVDA